MYRHTAGVYFKKKGEAIAGDLITLCIAALTRGSFLKAPSVISSIYDTLNKVEKIRNANGNRAYPTQNFLYQNLWGYCYDNDEAFEDCLEDLRKRTSLCHYKLTGHKLEEIHPEVLIGISDVCYNYFTWLSAALEEKTYVEESEVTEALKKVFDIFKEIAG